MNKNDEAFTQSVLRLSRQALAIAYDPNDFTAELALEISLKDGLSMITWSRLDGQVIRGVVGIKKGRPS